MRAGNMDILNSSAILENLTRTLLYEGYALYPYHRSAVKNQKPIPFGVVFPEQYNSHNPHAHSTMQTQCIVTGNSHILFNLSIRFLHLIKVELLERDQASHFRPANDLNVNGESYQAGWQTFERIINARDVEINQLIENQKTIILDLDKMEECSDINNEKKEIVAKEIKSVSEINGTITIDATPVENRSDAFRTTINITNTTPVTNPGTVSRDEMLGHSLLSTHIIINAVNGQFISHQNPNEQWKASIESCKNLNTWPILIDESDTTLLSSPIILYDYPQIHPQSATDLFDSTEIEEALLLHVAVLSDEEKERIAASDEKLRTMLNKVKSVTPAALINLHSGLKENLQNQFTGEKKSKP